MHLPWISNCRFYVGVLLVHSSTTLARLDLSVCSYDHQLLELKCVGPESLRANVSLYSSTLLHSVKTLSVFWENLTVLDTKMLAPFSNLESLQIVKSNLTEITDNLIFTQFTHLKHVDLSYNKLEALNWRLFAHLKIPIMSVNLTGNPLLCDHCQNQWLTEWEQLSEFDYVVCSSDEHGPNLTLSHRQLHIKLHLILDYDSLYCLKGERKIPIRQARPPCPRVSVKSEPSCLEIFPHAGASAQFHCNATLDRPVMAHIDQHFDVTALKSTGATIEEKKTSEGLKFQSVIKIGSVEVSNAGLVVCDVESPVLGRPFSSVSALAVYSKPLIERILKTDHSNSIVAIYRITVSGFPRPKVAINGPVSFNTYVSDINRILVHCAVHGNISAEFEVNACNRLGCESRTYVPDKISSSSSATADTKEPAYLLIFVLIICGILFVACLTVGFIKKRKKARGRSSSSTYEMASWAAGANGCGMWNARGRMKFDFLPRSNDFETDSTLTPLSDTVENPLYLTPTFESSIHVIDITELSIAEKIGKGAHGTVYYGVYYETPETFVPVAVKSLNLSSASWSEVFMNEAKVIASLDHPNIVRFFGICPQIHETLLLFEYMNLGDLKSYLQSTVNDAASLLSENEMVSIATQIASGLSYLAEKQLVHRDVAARNCLLKSPLTAKLSDFGLSRAVSYKYYESRSEIALPIRWLAPESLMYSRFSSETDMWSFGVFLWELFSYGKTPWHALSNYEVVERVQQNENLPCPPNCPSEVYELMLMCWKVTERITAPEAHDYLQSLNEINSVD